MDKNELLKNLPDEAKEHPFVQLAIQAGPEAVDSLMNLLGGRKPHIPTKDNFWGMLEREIRNDEIRKEFRGNNYDSIAQERDLDETTVRKIVHRRKNKRTVELGAPVKINRDIHARLKTLKTELQASSDRVVASALLKEAMNSPEIVSNVAKSLKGNSHG